MISLIGLSFLIYVFYGWLCYYPDFKGKSWLIWAGLGCAIAANAIWIYISKQTLEPKRLMTYALYWDVAVTVSSLVVPLLIFRIRLSSLGWMGLVLIVLGVWLVKFN